MSKMAWVHLPVWVIAEMIRQVNIYGKIDGYAKRIYHTERVIHKPEFLLACRLVNMYLEHTDTHDLLVQITFPRAPAFTVRLLKHSLLSLTGKQPMEWEDLLFKLMLKDDWLGACARETKTKHNKKAIITVYCDSITGEHCKSEWSYV